MTWHICTRDRRLSSTPFYPFRAIKVHLFVERELFVFGVSDTGRIAELMYYTLD